MRFTFGLSRAGAFAFRRRRRVSSKSVILHVFLSKSQSIGILSFCRKEFCFRLTCRFRSVLDLLSVPMSFLKRIEVDCKAVHLAQEILTVFYLSDYAPRFPGRQPSWYMYHNTHLIPLRYIRTQYILRLYALFADSLSPLPDSRKLCSGMYIPC